MQGAIKKINILVIFLGMFLHAYTLLSNSSQENSYFSIGLMVFSVFPYAICLLIFLIQSELSLVSLGGAFASLIIDSLMYYSVFINPEGSTAALGLLFAPLWNLFIFMPIGMVFGYAIKKGKAL